jgi:PBP1b-binding outer membrane lipoprotein LpoB
MKIQHSILLITIFILFISGCVKRTVTSSELGSVGPVKTEKEKTQLTEEEKKALREADMWVPDEK